VKERIRRIKSLVRHKVAFFKWEKQILGKHTLRGLTHDLDKLLMYLTPLPIQYVRDKHKAIARHHNPTTFDDYREKLVDYECARFTKVNSRLTAIQYVKKKYTYTKDVNRVILLAFAIQYGLKE
jgi:hypothetical protein